MAEKTNEDRYLVPGLMRGLSVIRLFTPERPAMSLAEIAKALDITRSAAFRTVYTLSEAGYLLLDERAHRYVLGPAVLRLSYGYVATREIVEIAQPELERLRQRTGWSSHMGILDGTSVLYVLRVPAPRRDPSIVQVGSRLPARGTVMGRVLLAGLGEEELIALYRKDLASGPKGKGPALPGILEQAARDRLHAVVIHTGDFEASIVSAAAPVRDMTGQVVAAINVTAPKSAEAEQELQAEVRDDLSSTAHRISRLLGWDPRDQEA
ncbi:IclR family transcriptional regulator [Celeribacter halophilus]|uniref:IclR family transcriptional regulator n=1 Tax=Celeribacter halophilus TaxID=576117 RepID=UPI001C08853A|nr:IclR family transcriptional regulator [Celeribacter halophilus]MBU2888461.1 IclR family transcriptional regulator [Celeribacter halophilus]MDO6509185.1 IclR family transcriptional regulator [Celeribacter halophilus]